MHAHHRTELLVGKQGLELLKNAHVMIIGVGGVGSYAAEALARAGVGRIDLVDFDDVCITNINRQLHAVVGSFGKPKVQMMKDRIRSVNPSVKVEAFEVFYSETTSEELLARKPDLILDGIDNMTAKTHLIKACDDHNIPVVVCMGAANKMDPLKVKFTEDLQNSSVCALARIVRLRMRKLGVESAIPCVYSEEEPRIQDPDALENFECICPDPENEHHSCDTRKVINGTISYMPATFGLVMSSVAIRWLLGEISLGRYGFSRKANLLVEPKNAASIS